FDINCGVRLLASTLTLDEVRPKIRELVNQLFRDIPSGVGQSGNIRLSYQELDRLLEDGAAWMVEHSYGRPEDLDTCEENGAIDAGDPTAVSDRAKKRGLPQVGTLGSGNHFLEVQYVELIFDPAVAQTLGLYENEILIMIHSGSRGLGHQVCTDYLRDMDAGMRRYGIELPDRQLACVPVHSKEGQEYLAAMRASANFAWANRQGITHFARQAFQRKVGDALAVGPGEVRRGPHRRKVFLSLLRVYWNTRQLPVGQFDAIAAHTRIHIAKVVGANLVAQAA